MTKTIHDQLFDACYNNGTLDDVKRLVAQGADPMQAIGEEFVVPYIRQKSTYIDGETVDRKDFDLGNCVISTKGSTEKFRYTCWCVLCMNAKLDILKYLIEYSHPDLNADLCYGGQMILVAAGNYYALKHKRISQLDEADAKLLNDYLSVITYLARAGADPNIRDEYDNSVYSYVGDDENICSYIHQEAHRHGYE